ncbi:Slc35f5, partial [Symbiodinium sp. CCMP2592]
DEFTEVVGRLGEEAAMQALKNQGFDVIWANGVNETGLPFDLLVRPAGGRLPWPPALAALSQHKGAQPKAHSLREIEAALARSPEVAVVEVKASLAAARG